MKLLLLTLMHGSIHLYYQLYRMTIKISDVIEHRMLPAELRSYLVL